MEWLKRIISEVVRWQLKNAVKKKPLIVASGLPKQDDIYSKGTTWKDLSNNKKYLCTDVRAEWQEIGGG